MASNDKKQDAKVTKNMTPKQKAAWEKADKKMDAKPMTRAQDVKADKALAKKVKRSK